MFNNILVGNLHAGYIAGTGVGIVTAKGLPLRRKIWLINAKSMLVDGTTLSFDSGHYLFLGVDVNKEYLVMVRDHKREFEPFAWDYVKPADDLTIEQQQVLWQTWQT